MGKYNIVIVDDHNLISNSLKKLIEGFKTFHVSHQLPNGKKLVELLTGSDFEPDLILLDMNMPILDGNNTMKWLNANKPELKVLILSVNDSEESILEMLRLGARGYIFKDIVPEEFRTALNEVINNGFYHSKAVNSILLDSLSGSDISLPNFSENERNFMKLACTEKTYKEIAVEMCLSPKTIDGYRNALFKKIGAKSRTGLVVFALKNKFANL